jgi:DNA anti-recombination protein RmuC
MKRLNRIVLDSDKLSEGFRRLGKHISDASSSYEDGEKRLSLMVDRVKNVIELGKKESEQISEPKT